MSVIYALNPVLHLPSLLESDDLLIESQFLLPIGQNTCPNSMPHEVPLVSEVDEVVVDGGGVDVPGLSARRGKDELGSSIHLLHLPEQVFDWLS